MRSLAIVQKIFFILKILATIIMVLCFVGAGISLLASISVNALSDSDIATIISTMPIYSETFENFSIGQLSGMMFIAFVLTLTEGILALFTRRFAQAELQEGTPFTDNNVANLRLLGILLIVLPFTSDLVISFIIKRNGITDMDYSGGSSMMIGLILLIASFVLQLGIEIIKEAKNRPDDPDL